MKAVMWTDTLQALVMFMGMLAVIIQGCMIVGWEKVWKDATESGRVNLNKQVSVDLNWGMKT